MKYPVPRYKLSLPGSVCIFTVCFDDDGSVCNVSKRSPVTGNYLPVNKIQMQYIRQNICPIEWKEY